MSESTKPRGNSYIADMWLRRFAARAPELEGAKALRAYLASATDWEGQATHRPSDPEMERRHSLAVEAAAKLEPPTVWTPSDAAIRELAAALDGILVGVKSGMAKLVAKAVVSRWAYFGLPKRSAKALKLRAVRGESSVELLRPESYWTEAAKHWQLARHGLIGGTVTTPDLIGLRALSGGLGEAKYSDLVDALEAFSRGAPADVRAALTHDAYPSCDERDAIMTSLASSTPDAHAGKLLARLAACGRDQTCMLCAEHGEVCTTHYHCGQWACRQCRVPLSEYEYQYLRRNYTEPKYVLIDRLRVADKVWVPEMIPSDDEVAISIRGGSGKTYRRIRTPKMVPGPGRVQTGDLLSRMQVGAADVRRQLIAQMRMMSRNETVDFAVREFQGADSMVLVAPATYVGEDGERRDTLWALAHTPIQLSDVGQRAGDRVPRPMPDLADVAHVREVTREELIQEIIQTKIEVWGKFDEMLLAATTASPRDAAAARAALTTWPYLRASAMRTSASSAIKTARARLPWYSQSSKRAEKQAEKAASGGQDTGTCPIPVATADGGERPCGRLLKMVARDARTEEVFARSVGGRMWTPEELAEHRRSVVGIPVGRLPARDAGRVELERMLA